MRQNILLAISSLVAWSAAGAQTVTWNDRMSETEWLRDAPDVRVILSSRSVGYQSAVGVSFEVSDNAYVAVVRVAGDGKMTILYPHTRNQRPFVRAGRRHDILNPRVGGAGFLATDRYGGYVFAIASFAPLDLSAFESRDFDRFGAYSPFTQANRSIARQPDVFIDRFAAQVLWDRDTPYDYDVDYYFQDARTSLASTSGYSVFNALTLCATRFIGMNTLQKWQAIYDLDDYWDFVPVSYRALCRDYYAGLQCLSYLAAYNTYTSRFCGGRYRDERGDIVISPVNGDGQAEAVLVNEAIVRGGLFSPSPSPIPLNGGDSPEEERKIDLSQFTTSPPEWSEFRSIPKRATDRLKAESPDAARRAREGATSSGTTADRPARVKDDALADNDRAVNRPPPAREPTKTKSTSEPRQRARPTTDFGPTSRPTSRPTHDRPVTPRPDPVTQPTTKTTTGSAPSRPTTTTKPPATTETKTKPPTE